MIWHTFALIIFITALILLALRIVFFILTRKRDLVWNEESYRFIENELISRNPRSAHLYKNSNESLPEINKFIFSKRKNRQTLIVEYNENLEALTYQVYCYNRKHNLIEIIQVNETNINKYSEVMKLDKKCRYINLVEDSKGANFDKSKLKQPLYLILFDTLIFFLSLIPIMYLVILIFAGATLSEYLDNGGWGFSFIFILIGTLIFFTFLSTKYNNRYHINVGGQ